MENFKMIKYLNGIAPSVKNRYHQKTILEKLCVKRGYSWRLFLFLLLLLTGFYYYFELSHGFITLRFTFENYRIIVKRPLDTLNCRNVARSVEQALGLRVYITNMITGYNAKHDGQYAHSNTRIERPETTPDA